MKTEAFLREAGWSASRGAAVAPLAGAIAAAWLAIAAAYWPTLTAMAAIWTRSETFAHGWVVLPLAVWLAWRGRENVAWHRARPWWPALIAVACAAAAWLVGTLAAAQSVEQVAFVVMLQATAVAILGPVVSRQLALPLALLLFLAPVGEFLVPMLIDWTADFTVAALRLTGVPVYREGNFFIIPSGAWSVVEGCSGIRYIVASLMAGLVFANLTYRSRSRRLAFVAAAIVVPLAANWLRAYMIVMLGHLSDNRIAAGVDHLVYGWVFFGLVMGAMFVVAARWREDAPVPPAARSRAAGIAARPSARRVPGFLGTAMGAVVLAASGAGVGAAIAGADSGITPRLGTIAGENGWSARAGTPVSWQPHYHGQRATLHETFAKDGREVALFIAYYRDQAQGRELVNSQNGVVVPSEVQWRLAGSRRDTVPWDGRAVPARLTAVVGPAERFLAADFYWVDGRVTASDYVAKALLVVARLLGRGDDAAAVVLYTRPGEDRAAAEASLDAFAADMSPAIARALARTRNDAGGAQVALPRAETEE
jgi:exosortase A